MASKRLDIMIEQGSNFNLTVNAKNADGTAKNLNGYSAKMQVRPTIGSSTIYVDASTVNGMISINGPQGQVTVTISGTVTALYEWYGGVFDLKVENEAEVIRLVFGDVSLIKQVTR